MDILDGVIARVADKTMHSGRPESAVRIANWYTRIRPRHPDAWSILGKILIVTQGPPATEEMLKRALLRHPGALSLKTQLADCMVYQGRYEEAENILRSLVVHHPDELEPRVSLADLYKMKREWARARAEAAEAEQRFRTREGAAQLVELAGVVLAIPGEEEWGARLLTKAAEYSENYLAHMMLGLLAERRDSAAASEHFAQGFKLWDGSKRGFEEKLNSLRLLIPPRNDARED